MEAIVLFARRDLPQHGIRRGDRIVFDPANSPYPALHRDLTNTGAILDAFEAGDLFTVTPSVRLTDLRLAVGADALVSGQPEPTGSARPVLTLVR